MLHSASVSIAIKAKTQTRARSWDTTMYNCGNFRRRISTTSQGKARQGNYRCNMTCALDGSDRTSDLILHNHIHTVPVWMCRMHMLSMRDAWPRSALSPCLLPIGIYNRLGVILCCPPKTLSEGWALRENLNRFAGNEHVAWGWFRTYVSTYIHTYLSMYLTMLCLLCC
ncbi:hypothetical protein BJX64DRAFT_266096 [Aspergillus heterothallicus]